MNAYFVMNSAYAPSSSGLSLIELLTVMAIASILLGLGMPQFRALYERWQVLQTARSLESTLMLARRLAIQRGGNIGIHKYGNTPQGCQSASTNQEWGCGWFIYADLNGNNTWDAAEPKLQEITLDGRVRAKRTSGGININIDRFGMASGLNAKSFILSPARTGSSAPSTHTLCMGSGGRIRIINKASCTK